MGFLVHFMCIFWLTYMQPVVCFHRYVDPSPLIKSQLLMINCQMS